MRKGDKYLDEFYNEKRFDKRLKRSRILNSKHRSSNEWRDRTEKFQLAHDEKVLSHKVFPLDEFLMSKGFFETPFRSPEIVFPKYFCLKTHYEETFKFIKKIVATITKFSGSDDFVFDFSKCSEVDFAALFLLGVLIREYREFLDNLDKKLYRRKVSINAKSVASSDTQVNNLLIVTNFLPVQTVTGEPTGLQPISTTGFLRGERNVTHYLKNQKGPAATKIAKYLNDCLGSYGYELNAIGESNITSIIGEVLNNAEDHSENGKWYLSGVFLRSVNESDGELVGEMHLAFLNFGPSFFEAFETTSQENLEVSKIMEELFNGISGESSGFSKESLYCLYSLQDGISRLKFEDESRGTGTMRFINSFFELGDYVDKKRNFEPSLVILTGRTSIICELNDRPYLVDGHYCISLNAEKDLSKAPANGNLLTLKSGFPGTLLSIKIYLNKEHLDRKFSST